MPIQSVSQALGNETSGSFIFRNKIINGSMAIDQRYVGTSKTISTADWGGKNVVDRFGIYKDNATLAVTGQQVTDAPSEFTNSLKVTVTTSASYNDGQFYVVYPFEGTTMVDLMWGTPAAKPVTLSFWIKSSVVGTYVATFRNGAAANRTLVAPYTINQANTWEYKTITIPGPTDGSWVTTTDVFGFIFFDLGSTGYTSTNTTNQWNVEDKRRIASAVTLNTTQGATWQITGVQFEKGRSATPFEFRPYPIELQMCQRYFEKTYLPSEIPGANYDAIASAARGYSFGDSNSQSQPFIWNFKVSKRASTTINIYNPYNGTANQYRILETAGTCPAQVIKSSSSETATVASAGAGLSSNYRFDVHVTASSEL